MSDERRCDNCRYWKPAVSQETGKTCPRSQPGECEYPVTWPKKLPSAYGNACRAITPQKWRMWFNDGYRCECFEQKSKATPQKQEDLIL